METWNGIPIRGTPGTRGQGAFHTPYYYDDLGFLRIRVVPETLSEVNGRYISTWPGNPPANLRAFNYREPRYPGQRIINVPTRTYFAWKAGVGFEDTHEPVELAEFGTDGVCVKRGYDSGGNKWFEVGATKPSESPARLLAKAQAMADLLAAIEALRAVETVG